MGDRDDIQPCAVSSKERTNRRVPPICAVCGVCGVQVPRVVLEEPLPNSDIFFWHKGIQTKKTISASLAGTFIVSCAALAPVTLAPPLPLPLLLQPPPLARTFSFASTAHVTQTP